MSMSDEMVAEAEAEFAKARRERIAVELLKAVLANGCTDYGVGPDLVIDTALEYTDALIARLDKEKQG